MKLLTKGLLDQYLQDDLISKLMDEHFTDEDEDLKCQIWLRESAPKRLVFNLLYGDLLSPESERLKVLDVGGGLSGFTKFLSKKHDYFLVDFQAHNNDCELKRILKNSNRDFIYPMDWIDLKEDNYDIIIANDIFPNVDQRLDIFLKKFLPRCKLMSLSLTWYNFEKYFQVRRTIGDEIFTILSWDQSQTMRVIKKYKDRVIDYSSEKFNISKSSLYPNGRSVGIIEFKGGNPN